MSTTGIKLVHVPYKGGALAMADLLGGHVLAIFENVPVGAPSVRAGKVRALGVTAAKRSAQLPDVPTFIEAGFPGFEIYAWYGVCAPAATPKAVKTSDKATDMLRFDLDNENETIRNYRERLRQCEALEEYAIAEDIREILRQEQEHQSDLANALGEDVPDVSKPRK